MTDLPTLIKQSRDLERKIKKIKTRIANRDLIDKRKTLEVQIDQQTKRLNDINGNIQSSQKQMLDVCNELGEAACQVKRLSKYDKPSLEVVLVRKIVDSCACSRMYADFAETLGEQNEKKSFTEFRKLRRARKQVMEMEKLLDDFNKVFQEYRNLISLYAWARAETHLVAKSICMKSQKKFG